MTSSSAVTEELPLLIQDYSCANSFEEHVRLIETYLATLFDSEPLLQSFLISQAPSAKSTRAFASPKLKQRSTSSSPGPGCDIDSDNEKAASTSSLVSLLDDPADGHHRRADVGSHVFSQTMTLYASSSATPTPQLDLDLTVAVEAHVRDAGHLITQQFCTPLFFLIRKVGASAAYRESESNYLLALLSTAVRQVLRQQKNGAVLRIGAVSSSPISSLRTSSVPVDGVSRAAAEELPSPFFFPDGCAPCFAPAGDSYKQSFVGVAPPLPSLGALPPCPPSSEVTSAEWSLLHQRTFTTRFLSDAFAHPPEHCRTLSEFIDLFQLHVGQHSRIRSDDFEGICVSTWQTHALPIPWKFHPHGPPSPPDAAAAAAAAADRGSGRKIKSSGLKASGAGTTEGTVAGNAALTWEAVLERENDYTQLLSGPVTHRFGTSAPPLKHVLFHFQWNQLQDVEAHEPSGRGSHLDPFQFATAPLTTAAQAAQRKCCITAQAIVRGDDDIEGGVSQRLREVIEQRFLDPLAQRSATSPVPQRPQKEKGKARERTDGSSAAAEPPVRSPTTTTTSPRSRDYATSPTEDDDGADTAQLHELAAHLIDWTGANVQLTESLLRRFASLSPHGGGGGGDAQLSNGSNNSNSKGGTCSEWNSTENEGREGQTRAGVLVAAAERSGTIIARRLRSLWDAWEAHRQLFPVEGRPNVSASQPAKEADGAKEQQEQTSPFMAAPNRERTRRDGESSSDGAATGEKDLRADYFPESLFARFAYACATQVQHAEDAHALWRLCVDRLRDLLVAPPGPESSSGGESATEEQDRKKSWQHLLDCLALPRADPPVDLSRPLLSQKFQLLRFAVYALLHPSEVVYPAPDASFDHAAAARAAEEAAEEHEAAATAACSELRLITNGEVLVAPAPLPTPPTTSDLVLQRAMELNTRGAAAVDTATTAWLHEDALYNDMCLFLFSNHAQDGVVVRFPDFVHWHSPRDFVAPAESTTKSNDSDYLSDRMKDQPDGGRGSAHVWWSLWRRAVPRSREEILQTLFQPYEEACRVLDWLAALPAPTLLLEISNACIANALHQLLCHRFLLGDRAPREGRSHRPSSNSNSSRSGGGGRRYGIPASPRLRSLHRYIQSTCTNLTKDLEAASAMFASRPDMLTGGAAHASPTSPLPFPSAMEAMELEMLRTFMANALREVGEVEVALCTAISIHYLLGFAADDDDDAAATVRALCVPLLPSQPQQQQQQAQQGGGGLRMRTVTVSRAAWTNWFARQFVRPESRAVQESMVRLTCMAERPLNTCGCFQQLVVHQDASHTLRMALALTREVL